MITSIIKDGFLKTAGKKLLLKDGMNFGDKGALSLGKILGLSAAVLNTILLLLIVFFWLLKHNKNFFSQLIKNKWFISILFLNIIYILGLFWGDNHQDGWYVIKSNLLFLILAILDLIRKLFIR